jgi:hypothetical protein
MKTIKYNLINFATAALAALAVLSCEQPVEHSGGTPAASAETGIVVVTASAEGGVPAENGASALNSAPIGGTVRTILPTEAPQFSRYALVFSRNGYSDITIDNAGGVAGSGESRELAAGTWIATVTAYRTFTVDVTATEYAAARGSAEIAVSAGAVTPVTVNIAPIPVTDTTVKGIFTYTVTFPAGASGTLQFGTETPVPLVSGHEVSVEKTPGIYDLTVSLAKGENLSAGLWEKVHIYAGLESKAAFMFADADFAATVYLAGTLALPGGVTLSGGTVKAYSDAGYTAQIGQANAAASWIVGVPATHVGMTVYLMAIATGTNGKTYIGTGNSGGAVPETGARGIVLSDTTPPADVSGLSGTPGNRQVTLSWNNPADADIDYIKITGSATVTVSKGTRTSTITGLVNTVNTFTVKTVDTAGHQSGGITVVVVPNGNYPIADIAGVQAYLSSVSGGTSADNPVPLAAEFSFASNWDALLSSIQSAGKYVALDLSACAGNAEFDPGTANTGEKYITGLALPNAATSIKAGTGTIDQTFKNFTALKRVSGSAVETVGAYAFSNCAALKEVNLPKAKSIGDFAFNCTALESVYLPKAETIGGLFAFQGCAALTEVNLPAATFIGPYAFWECAALTTVNLPKAVNIGGCAFYGCDVLKSVYLPAATIIFDDTFYGCNALEEVYLPASAPALGNSTIREVSTPKTVTVRVPPGATGYDDAWKNNFKGGNSNITVNVVYGNTSPIAYISAYLQSASGGTSAATPVSLSVSLNLADSENGWTSLLSAIDSAGKYVALDLSACTGNAQFDPGTASTGKDRIVSLVLPNAATSIKDGPHSGGSGYSTFRYFTALKSVSGANVETVGEAAFFACAALTTVSLPAATSIGDTAFFVCDALTTVSLPKATSIGQQAFDECAALTTVTLGATAPTLGYYMFHHITTAKTVTVKVPSGAAGYGTVPATYSGSTNTTANWGNGFRGGGWNGSAFINGASDINTNITVVVQYQ